MTEQKNTPFLAENGAKEKTAMESQLAQHKFKTQDEVMSSLRAITPERAVEIYLTMNGSEAFRDRVTMDDMEGLIPANGATYGQWLGWNRNRIIVKERIE